MEFRSHTEQTLRHYKAGVLLVSVGLSAALIVSPAYSGPITSVIALGALLGMVKLRAEMPTRTADLSLVSKAERRTFLIENTVWVIAMLIAGGAVFALVFTRHSLPVRVGLGHVALVLFAISACLTAKTAAAHGQKISAPNVG